MNVLTGRSKLNKLIEKAKLKLNVELSEDEKEELNKLLKITPKLIAHKDNSMLTDKLIDKCDQIGVKVIQDLPHVGMSYYMGDGKSISEIHISKSPIAVIFAHEVGHAISHRDNPSTISRQSFNLYGISSLIFSLGALFEPIGTWYLGNKTNLASNKLTKIAGWGVASFLLPYVLFSPVLVQENYATKYGLNLCKEYGASSDYLVMGKTCLKAAYKTYKMAPLQSSIMNLIGYGYGVASNKDI